MSARDYRECPRCLEAKRLEVIERSKAVSLCYGQELQETYLSRVKKLEQFKAESLDRTLAEYWDVGFSDDGSFSASFRFSCDACGFSFEHRTTAKADITPK